MLTVVDRSVKISDDADTSEFEQCPDGVYAAWIKRVHENHTPVSVGDSYVWLYLQLLPPRLVNCIITVKAGDEYPPVPLEHEANYNGH